MLVRPATEKDISACQEIYDSARVYMRENDNASQWDGEYPGGYDVALGIEGGTSYVCEDEGEIVATFHFERNADDPSYRKIYEGKWKNDMPYAVIHRIAVRHHKRGIADYCFKWAFEQFPNIRIDTHDSNIPMKKCLLRNGFEYCGVIFIVDIEDKEKARRIAFQHTK